MQVMDGLHKDILLKYRDCFMKSIEIDKIKENLLLIGILNDTDISFIEKETANESKIEKLLDILPTKGKTSFKEFCKILENTYPQLLTLMFLGSYEGPPDSGTHEVALDLAAHTHPAQEPKATAKCDRSAPLGYNTCHGGIMQTSPTDVTLMPNHSTTVGDDQFFSRVPITSFPGDRAPFLGAGVRHVLSPGGTTLFVPRLTDAFSPASHASPCAASASGPGALLGDNFGYRVLYHQHQPYRLLDTEPISIPKDNGLTHTPSNDCASMDPPYYHMPHHRMTSTSTTSDPHHVTTVVAISGSESGIDLNYNSSSSAADLVYYGLVAPAQHSPISGPSLPSATPTLSVTMTASWPPPGTTPDPTDDYLRGSGSSMMTCQVSAFDYAYYYHPQHQQHQHLGTKSMLHYSALSYPLFSTSITTLSTSLPPTTATTSSATYYPASFSPTIYSMNKAEYSLSSGSSELLSKMYDTALEKYERVKRDHEALQRKCAEQTASHETALCRAETEASRARSKLEAALEDRAALVRENFGLKQHCAALSHQLDSTFHDTNELREQVQKVTQQRDEAIKEMNHALAMQIRAAKDLERRLIERNAAVQEYSLVMAERDTVHKEMDKLQEDIGDAKKRVEELERENKEMTEELQLYRREIECALADRDKAINEGNHVKDKYGEVLTLKGLAEKERDEALKDYDSIIAERDAARQERSRALDHRNLILQELYRQEHIEDSNKEEIDKRLRSLESQLNETQWEADIARKRRDWAFKERDKIVSERDTYKQALVQVQHDKDRLMSHLVVLQNGSPKPDLQDDSADNCPANDPKVQGSDGEQKDPVANALPISSLVPNLPTSKAFSTGTFGPILGAEGGSFMDKPTLHWETIACQIDVVPRYQTFSDFGLVVGALDELGLRVEDVSASSPLYGKLRKNDCITKLNDTDLRVSFPLRIGQKVIEARPDSLKIIANRTTVKYGYENDQGQDLRVITLTGAKGKELGLTLSTVVYVKDIAEGSIACQNNNLHVADHILKVNGVALAGKGVNETLQLMGNFDDYLTLTVTRDSRNFYNESDLNKNGFDNYASSSSTHKVAKETTQGKILTSAPHSHAQNRTITYGGLNELHDGDQITRAVLSSAEYHTPPNESFEANETASVVSKNSRITNTSSGSNKATRKKLVAKFEAYFDKFQERIRRKMVPQPYGSEDILDIWRHQGPEPGSAMPIGLKSTSCLVPEHHLANRTTTTTTAANGSANRKNGQNCGGGGGSIRWSNSHSTTDDIGLRRSFKTSYPSSSSTRNQHSLGTRSLRGILSIFETSTAPVTRQSLSFHVKSFSNPFNGPGHKSNQPPTTDHGPKYGSARKAKHRHHLSQEEEETLATLDDVIGKYHPKEALAPPGPNHHGNNPTTSKKWVRGGNMISHLLKKRALPSSRSRASAGHGYPARPQTLGFATCLPADLRPEPKSPARPKTNDARHQTWPSCDGRGKVNASPPPSLLRNNVAPKPNPEDCRGGLPPHLAIQGHPSIVSASTNAAVYSSATSSSLRFLLPPAKTAPGDSIKQRALALALASKKKASKKERRSILFSFWPSPSTSCIPAASPTTNVKERSSNPVATLRSPELFEIKESWNRERFTSASLRFAPNVSQGKVNLTPPSATNRRGTSDEAPKSDSLNPAEVKKVSHRRLILPQLGTGLGGAHFKGHDDFDCRMGPNNFHPRGDIEGAALTGSYGNDACGYEAYTSPNGSDNVIANSPNDSFPNVHSRPDKLTAKLYANGKGGCGASTDSPTSTSKLACVAAIIKRRQKKASYDSYFGRIRPKSAPPNKFDFHFSPRPDLISSEETDPARRNPCTVPSDSSFDECEEEESGQPPVRIATSVPSYQAMLANDKLSNAPKLYHPAPGDGNGDASYHQHTSTLTKKNTSGRSPKPRGDTATPGTSAWTAGARSANPQPDERMDRASGDPHYSPANRRSSQTASPCRGPDNKLARPATTGLHPVATTPKGGESVAATPKRPQIGEVRSIVVDKSTEPLGIQIECVEHAANVTSSHNGTGEVVCPSGPALRGIFISSVSVHGLAYLAGLQVGDQMLEVCGINLRNATYPLAANVLRNCGQHMTILVQYNPDKYFLGEIEPKALPQQIKYKANCDEDSLGPIKESVLGSDPQLNTTSSLGGGSESTDQKFSAKFSKMLSSTVKLQDPGKKKRSWILPHYQTNLAPGANSEPNDQASRHFVETGGKKVCDGDKIFPRHTFQPYNHGSSWLTPCGTSKIPSASSSPNSYSAQHSYRSAPAAETRLQTNHDNDTLRVRTNKNHPGPPRRLGDILAQTPTAVDGNPDQISPYRKLSSVSNPYYYLPTPRNVTVKRYRGGQEAYRPFAISRVPCTETAGYGIQLIGGNSCGIFVRDFDEASVGRAGLVRGDHILEINGTDIRNFTAEDAAIELNKYDAVNLVVQHDTPKFIEAQKINGSGCDSFYVKALFDHDPQVGGSGDHYPVLKFRRGDVLYIDDTMHDGKLGAWRAWLLDAAGNTIKCGIVPSKWMLEEGDNAFVNEKWHAQVPSHLTAIFSPPSSSRANPKESSSAAVRAKASNYRPFSSENLLDDNPTVTHGTDRNEPWNQGTNPVCGSISSKRSSLFGTTLRSQTVGKRSKLANNFHKLLHMAATPGHYDSGRRQLMSSLMPSHLHDDSGRTRPCYQKMERLDVKHHRPLVLYGPFVNEITEKMIQMWPEKFSRCEHEIMKGSLKMMEQGLAENIFFDYKRTGNHYEYLTYDNVKQLNQNQKSHCIVDMNPEALQRLRFLKIHPIIVLIKFKSSKYAKEFYEVNFKNEDSTIANDLKRNKTVQESINRLEEEIRSSVSVYIPSSLVLERICEDLLLLVNNEQQKIVWIPVSKAQPHNCDTL